MSETSTSWAQTHGAAAGEDPAVRPLQRIVLDSRHPKLLDHRGLVLQVVSGHVDLFAVGLEGARRHLFRVETGGIVLNLPGTDRVQVIAVGGPGAEALPLPRQRLTSFDPVAAWISRIAETIAGPRADWSIRETEDDAVSAIAPAERRRGAARGIAWISVNAGLIRLMGAVPPYRPGDPPVPLTAGMWIEAGETGSTVAGGNRVPDGEALWRALDEFHLRAMACLQSRLLAEAEAEAERLGRRTQLVSAQAHALFESLAAVIVRQRDHGPPPQAADPLLAACQAVADAIHAPIVAPSGTIPARHAFEDVVEIARASRLRVRRVLLRGEWWRRDVGALLAWHGAERDPVALVPTSRHRYVMIEPRSGTRRVVDAAAAAELAPDAATFYPTLPARPLAYRDLLTLCMRQSRGNGLRIIVGALAMGLLSWVPPLVTHALVDSVIPRTEFDQLAYCAAALAVTAIAMAALQTMQGVAVLRLEGVLDWKVQAAMLDRLLRLPASLFRQYTVGDLADRTMGIDAVRRIVTGRAIRGLLAGFFCWFSFILMFYYDFRLALIAVVLTAVRAIAIAVASATRLRHETRHFNLQGKVQGLVLQLLAGIGKLKVAAANVRALAVWAKQFAEQKRYFIASQRAANALGVFEASYPTLATLVIFAAAYGFASELLLDLGAFLAFFAAFGQSMTSVGELTLAVSELLIAIPPLSRTRPLIASDVEVSEERRSAGELSGAIELSRVTFRYLPGGPPVLDNVTLRIAPGEYLAVVGPSGSGKSTIFRLLLGFEKPESGVVFFDGKGIETLDVGTVRRQMGVVLQNGRLRWGTIYDNICGGIQLPLEQAWEAARMAGLAADIEAMPMGMHTIVAEGVSTLSGGQRQRLMIARAVARRPRILLLDEATSSLDNQAQATVSAALGRLNVTRIVIAHRLSTVREADRIVVLVDGKIVQTGNFAELSSAPGMFAEFARRQLL